MQTITIKEIINAGKKAYDEKSLGAQRGYCDCRYIYPDGSHCVIGASLNDETIAQIKKNCENRSGFVAIIKDKYIDVKDSENKSIRYCDEEFNDLATLQNIHDKWCGSSDPEKDEKRFVGFLDFLLKKY
jgi:hypothetical protein